MVQILCTHECKQKKDTGKTIPGMRDGGGIKENGGGGKLKYDIFDTL
jgi:hypothetical protein